MRDAFSGYFEPSEADVARLWQGAKIVLDTNVLLGLYRLPKASRDQVIAVLQGIRERLWVPYHVLVEYHANRLEALRAEYSAAEGMEQAFQKAFVEYKRVVKDKKYSERACREEISNKVAEMERLSGDISAIARLERDNYVAPSEVDSVRDFWEALLDGRIGPRPVDQNAVVVAEQAAAVRYAAGMGPGCLDTKKAGLVHIVDGLIYDRQYGDYMVWRGLLDYCQKQNLRQGVIFVTSDVKEDWWLDTKGVAGKKPQPELVMEMRREGNVSDFGMYTLATFVENAKSRLHAQVNEQTIADAAKAEDAFVKIFIPVRAAQKKDESPNPFRMAKFEALGAADLLKLAEAMDLAVISVQSGIVTGVHRSEDFDEAALLLDPAQLVFLSDSALDRAAEKVVTRCKARVLNVYLVYPLRDGTAAGEGLAAYVEKRITPTLPFFTDLNIHVGSFLNDEKTEYMFELVG